MAQPGAAGIKSATIVQELSSGIASTVAANAEAREAQPDTITGWSSLDDETFKKAMAGALVNNPLRDGLGRYDPIYRWVPNIIYIDGCM